MLYGIGLMILLLSIAFAGGSAAMPVTVAAIGITLMVIGGRSGHGKTKEVQDLSRR